MNDLILITQSTPVKIRDVEIRHGNCEYGEDHFDLKLIKEKTFTTLIFHLSENSSFNEIQIQTNEIPENKLPISIFYSDDQKFWKRVPIRNIITKEKEYIFQTPLMRVKYLQMILHIKKNMQFLNIEDFNLKGRFLINIPINFKSSGNSDRLYVPDNLIDGRENYGWESDPRSQRKEEYIELDLNGYYRLSQINLRSMNDDLHKFPENFAIFLSNDRIEWECVVSEDQFFAAPECKYNWEFDPFMTKYLKLVIHKPDNVKNYSCKILELELYACINEQIRKHSEKNREDYSHPYASELVPGLVRFSSPNETGPFKAIQANDPRLKNASTEYPGIVQLARNGSEEPEKVVQGNDFRLRNATTEYPGIVKLSKKNESSEGLAIQSNDPRLKKATEKNLGIIRLAKNGENIPKAAVQGNDFRLRHSTTKYPGIVQLAEDGASNPNQALQSNDSRLRDSSISWKGIVQLAKHNEVSALKSLQSNDPRICEGTEEKKGRVQFARNRETSDLKAVQGSDDRLKDATSKRAGLVRISELGTKVPGSVIQSNDPRLEEPREPLPHSHDYADKVHELNSHSGHLNLHIDKEVHSYDSLELPPDSNFPLSVKNKKGLSASFDGGIIAKSTDDPGVSSISINKNSLEAMSKKSYAGLLFSEQSYALYLPQNINSLSGSGKSILAEGVSVFKGEVFFNNGLSLAVSWSQYSNEPYSPGDILSIAANGSITKLKNSHDPFMGVYVENPSFSLSANKEGIKDQTRKEIHIAILGIVKIRIKGNVQPGNWIGYLDGDPGVASKLENVQKQHGFAIAMESSDSEGENLVYCMLKKN